MPFEGYKRRDENSGYLQAGVVPKTTENLDGTLTQHVNIDAMPTGTVVVASSALPVGAATASNQIDGSQKTKIIGTDGSGLDVYTRTQTPANKVIGVQIGPGDVISNIPVVIEYDHHQLHEGEIFRWSSYTASMAGSANKDIQLIVPNITITTNAVTQCPHLRMEFISSVGGLAYLHEGTTFTATGTVQTPIAMERNGTYTPRLGVYDNPTISVLGTLLWQGFILTNSRAGGTDSSIMEFVLKNNTQYSIRFTSAGAQNQVLIRLIWYEDLGV